MVNVDLVLVLLSIFNWRLRIIGAHLAALRGLSSLEKDVGNPLLRSDVCYAGSAYALALARFNTQSAVRFLTDYLDYYLARKDLWFDQRDVLATVTCLDEWNGTTIAKRYDALWHDHSRDKPNLQLEAGVVRVRRQLEILGKSAVATSFPRDAG